MNKRVITAIAALALFFNAGTVFAYSYAEAEDPMAALFKSAVAAARKGSWDGVSSQVEKGISMQKNHTYEADHLASRFDKAIAEKNVSKVAEGFANLVYLSICEKLHQNKKENFENYKNSKARVNLAYKSYMDVLDGNVKKKDNERSAKIIDQFKVVLSSIGNPGLFGIGKSSSDSDGYDQAFKLIKELIVKSFPGFSK